MTKKLIEARQGPLIVHQREVADLRPYKGNARTHSKKQVRQIADSIKNLGFH